MLALAAAPLSASDDWPMYLRDPAHSSFNSSESKIDRSNIGTLQAAWKHRDATFNPKWANGW